MITGSIVLFAWLVVSTAAADPPPSWVDPASVTEVPGAVTLKANGGWCWYQGPRAIVTRDNQLVFTAIAGDDYAGYDAGDLWVTAWQLETGKTAHFELHDKLQRDDHDVAGLLERPDGRLLAVYGKHGNDKLQRWRISTRSGDISTWSGEAQLDTGAPYTYSNIFRLSKERGRIYNFSRTRGYNPNCTVSEDDGVTWHYGWRLLSWKRKSIADDPRYTGVDGGRPYLRYVSDNVSTIHFVATDDHPRAYDNSIYHGFYRGGQLHDSSGAVVGAPGIDGTSPVEPRCFTELFQGGPDRVAWTVDLELDAQGHPYTVFSVQVDGAAGRGQRDPRYGQDHRYYYGRADGDTWKVHEMAYAGSCLYTSESDYTGLVALDPHDPDFAVISTNADPQNGAPLISGADGQRHWELYSGRTTDGGSSWQWTSITSDSIVDNLRPIIPAWKSSQRIIVWARGDLTTFTDYRLDITGLMEDRR